MTKHVIDPEELTGQIKLETDIARSISPTSNKALHATFFYCPSDNSKGVVFEVFDHGQRSLGTTDLREAIERYNELP